MDPKENDLMEIRTRAVSLILNSYSLTSIKFLPLILLILNYCFCYFSRKFFTQFEKEDGTYHTQSDLIFNASRFENDVKFVCQAENIVLQINREAPMQSLLTLEVLCKY